MGKHSINFHVEACEWCGGALKKSRIKRMWARRGARCKVYLAALPSSPGGSGSARLGKKGRESPKAKSDATTSAIRKLATMDKMPKATRCQSHKRPQGARHSVSYKARVQMSFEDGL